MGQSFGLGKNSEYGSIDLSKLRTGIRVDDLCLDTNDPNIKKVLFNIFGEDGTLDAEDIPKLQDYLSGADTDDDKIITDREGRRIRDDEGHKVGRQFKDALFTALIKLSEQTKGIDSVTRTDSGIETVVFENGNEEEVGNHYIKTTQTNNEGAEVVEFKNDAGEVTQTTTTEKGIQTTIRHNDDRFYRIVYDSETHTEEIYNRAGKLVIKRVNGKDVELNEYNEEGNLTCRTQNFTEGDDPLVSQIVTSYHGNSEETIQQQTTQYRNGNKLIQTYDAEGNLTETRNESTLADGRVIATISSIRNGHTITQREEDNKIVEETCNGRTVKYNEDGNTVGVVVQNGESIALLAKRFGITDIQSIIDLNEDQVQYTASHKPWFKVGAEIVIPGRVEADNTVFNGRLDRAGVIAEFKRQQAEDKKKKQETQNITTDIETLKKELNLKEYTGNYKTFKDNNDNDWEVIGIEKHGNLMVANKNGNIRYAMENNNGITFIDQGFIEARATIENGEGLSCNSSEFKDKVQYAIAPNGKAWYFNDKGEWVGQERQLEIETKEAQLLSKQILKAAKGLGTNEEMLMDAVSKIYSPAILKQVNAELAKNGYKSKYDRMPLEDLILNEEFHQNARAYFHTLAKGKVMTNDEKARMAFRELDFVINGGLGVVTAKTSSIKDAMSLITNSKVREKVEDLCHKRYPYLQPVEGSYIRSYLRAKTSDAEALDNLEATWLKSGAYEEACLVSDNGTLKIAENDQARRNTLIDRLGFEHKSKESLHRCLDVMNDNPNSADFQHFSEKAGEVITGKKEYEARFEGQDNIQRYLAGRCTTENNQVDGGEISACNTLLFKGVKSPRVQAEEALYKIKQGDYSAAFDGHYTDETYEILNQLLKAAKIEGISNLQDAYKKALDIAAQQHDQHTYMTIKGDAIASGQIQIKEDELVDFCISLIHSCDSNRTNGGGGEKANLYERKKAQLQTIIAKNPNVSTKIREKVQSGEFKYTISSAAYASVMENPSPANIISIDTKNDWLKFIDESKYITTESIIYNGNDVVTDEALKTEIINANKDSLNLMRQYVAQLEREFKKITDSQGSFDRAGDTLVKATGLGTDSEDVATEYRNARLLLQQLEAAAEGKLRDFEGNVISVQDLAQQIIDQENKLTEMNGKYQQSVGMGKMFVILAPVMVVTMGAGAAATAAGLGLTGVAITSGAAAGGATYGLNAINYSTSYSGNTTEAREQNLEESIIAGGTTFIGVKQMGLVMKVGGTGALGTVTRFGTTVAADAATSAAVEYVTTGHVTKEGMITVLVMSGTGNIIGYKQFKKAQTTGVHNNGHNTNGHNPGVEPPQAGKSASTSEPNTSVEHTPTVGPEKPAPKKKTPSDSKINDYLSNANRNEKYRKNLQEIIDNPDTSIDDLLIIRDGLDAKPGKDTKGLRKSVADKISDFAGRNDLTPDEMMSLKQDFDNLSPEIQDALNNNSRYQKWEKLNELTETYKKKIEEATTPDEVKQYTEEFNREFNEQKLGDEAFSTEEIDNHAKNKSEALKAESEAKAQAEAEKAQKEKAEKQQKALDDLDKLKNDKNALTEEELKALEEHIENADPNELAELKKRIENINDADVKKRLEKAHEKAIDGMNFDDELDPAGKAAREEVAKARKQQKALEDLDKLKNDKNALTEEELSALEKHIENADPNELAELRGKINELKDPSTKKRLEEAHNDAVKKMNLVDELQINRTTGDQEPINIPSKKDIKNITNVDDLLKEYKRLSEATNSTLSNKERNNIGKRLDQITKRLQKDFNKRINSEGRLEDIPTKADKKSEKKTTKNENTNQSEPQKVKKMENNDLESEYKDLSENHENLSGDEKTKAQERMNEIEDELNKRGMTMQDDKAVSLKKVNLEGKTPEEIKEFQKKVDRIADKTQRKALQNEIDAASNPKHASESHSENKQGAEDTQTANTENIGEHDGFSWFGQHLNTENGMIERRFLGIKLSETAGSPSTQGRKILGTGWSVTESGLKDYSLFGIKLLRHGSNTGGGRGFKLLGTGWTKDAQGASNFSVGGIRLWKHYDGVSGSGFKFLGTGGYKDASGQINISLLGTNFIRIGNGGWEVCGNYFPFRMGQGIDGQPGFTFSLGLGGGTDASTFSGINFVFGKRHGASIVNGDLFGYFGKKRTVKSNTTPTETSAPTQSKADNTDSKGPKQKKGFGLGSEGQATRSTTQADNVDNFLSQLKEKYPKATKIEKTNEFEYSVTEPYEDKRTITHIYKDKKLSHSNFQTEYGLGQILYREDGSIHFKSQSNGKGGTEYIYYKDNQPEFVVDVPKKSASEHTETQTIYVNNKEVGKVQIKTEYLPEEGVIKADYSFQAADGNAAPVTGTCNYEDVYDLYKKLISNESTKAP